MKIRVIIAAVFALSYSAAEASPDDRPSDQRAIDSIALYSSFCVATDGTRERALTVLGNGNALATRLPDDTVRRLQFGREGGVAWAIRSPSNAQILLEYEARGICGVRIAEAEEAAVQDAFSQLVSRAAAGAEVSSNPEKTTNIEGARRTYKTYTVVLNGRKVLFALSSMDRRIGEQQHFLTFGHISD